MKTYNRYKFCYLRKLDGVNVRKEAVEGDYYYNLERRWDKTFPFYRKCIITYKLIDYIWVEQEDPDKFNANWDAYK